MNLGDFSKAKYNWKYFPKCWLDLTIWNMPPGRHLNSNIYKVKVITASTCGGCVVEQCPLSIPVITIFLPEQLGVLERDPCDQICGHFLTEERGKEDHETLIWDLSHFLFLPASFQGAHCLMVSWSWEVVEHIECGRVTDVGTPWLQLLGNHHLYWSGSFWWCDYFGVTHVL